MDFQSCTWAVVVSVTVVVSPVAEVAAVVVANSFAVVVSLAAAVVLVSAVVASVEDSAEVVTEVVPPPPLIRLESEPSPLQEHDVHEHEVSPSTETRAVTAQIIFNNLGFFLSIMSSSTD